MAKRQRRRRQERRKEHSRRGDWRMRHSVVTGAALTAGSVLGLAPPALATNFVVNNSGDAGNNVCEDATSGDCTLRDAVDSSNANTGVNDAITFASNITGVTLTGGQLLIYDGVYISGNGAGATSITTNGDGRIMYTDPPISEGVYISDLTLTGGNSGNYDGGAIFNYGANLNIYNSVLTGNHANDGGAVYEYGAYVGGYNTDIIDSTLNNNTASDDGGALYARRSMGQVLGSTISGNHAGSSSGELGGGIYNYLTSYFNDDTVAGNSAFSGGGVYSYYLNTMAAYNSIFAGNSAAASFGPDFVGAIYGAGSLVQSTTGTDITPAPGGPPNITGIDPQLGALQNNGGPTPTRLLAPTSPAIDKGFSYLGTDQRGIGRPIDISTVANAPNGDGSDIGAVELTAQEATIPSSPPPPVTPKKTKKKKCKKKKNHAAAAKKKKCKKKKKKHSAGVELRQSGAKDWPGDTFKLSPKRHAHSD